MTTPKPKDYFSLKLHYTLVSEHPSTQLINQISDPGRGAVALLMKTQFTSDVGKIT